MDLKAAIAAHGATAINEAATAALSGDYSKLNEMGLPAASLADAYAALSASHKAMSKSERAADQMAINAEIVRLGRPPLPDSERAKTRAIRLTDADYAELQRRGMDALREWLRR